MQSTSAAFFAAVSCVVALPAPAAEIEPSAKQQIAVHGDIASHCAIRSPGNVEFGDLSQRAAPVDLKAGLNCNVPFSLLVKAEHGALTNAEFPQGQGPYSGKLPYQLTFIIPTRSPSQAVISAMVDSKELVGGKSISSRGAIATEGMDIRVALGRPESDAGLIAGDYGETIVITVSPI